MSTKIEQRPPPPPKSVGKGSPAKPVGKPNAAAGKTPAVPPPDRDKSEFRAEDRPSAPKPGAPRSVAARAADAPYVATLASFQTTMTVPDINGESRKVIAYTTESSSHGGGAYRPSDQLAALARERGLSKVTIRATGKVFYMDPNDAKAAKTVLISAISVTRNY